MWCGIQSRATDASSLPELRNYFSDIANHAVLLMVVAVYTNHIGYYNTLKQQATEIAIVWPLLHN